MSRTKFMGIFLIILGVISVVVGIVRGDMTSSAAMFIGYLCLLYTSPSPRD